MADDQVQSDDQPSSASRPEPTTEASTEPARGRVWRYTQLVVVYSAALGAAALVSFVSVDLGPALRSRAEEAVSTQIERPVHMGKLSIHLLTGRFVVEDVVIEGLAPDDRPFLTCERIFVSISWGALLGGEFLIDSVDMTDFEMLVESFPDGRHSFPNFASPSASDALPEDPEDRRFVTTLQYIRAHRGQFAYEDHVAPWSVVAPNLDVTITKILDYRGQASFSDGTVRIGSFEPMGAEMRTTFTLDGGKVHLDRIELHTDGAESVLSGDVDFGNWPEMFYEVKSRLDLPRMREIFFADDDFTCYGEGDFTGTFHTFKGGRELKGTFASELFGINDYRVPGLQGSLIWLTDRFELFDATSGLYGGSTDFSLTMAPLGSDAPGLASFDISYREVDLAAFTDFLQTQGIRVAGRATGRNLLGWPLGHYAEHRGEGRVTVEPPDGVQVLGLDIPTAVERQPERREPSTEPLSSTLALSSFPIGGELAYTFGPEWITLAPSWMATPRTYVAFEGRTAYGERSRFPFHVTSADWQESDRVLAGLLTAFGAPTREVAVDGYGQFDGVMVGAFRQPRVEGRFAGQQLRAWGVFWGTVLGEIVVQDGYVDVTNGYVGDGPSELHLNGRFAAGFPRRDGGEEINARFRLVSRPAVDFRDAFRLEGYPIEGLLSGDLRLIGYYGRPFGFGRLTLDEAVVYGEPFDSVTADLRFEGDGVRLEGLDMRKGQGAMTGAAYVSWDATYSGTLDGRDIAVESVATLADPRAPLSGRSQFILSGAGAFDSPRYELRGEIADLFISDESIGHVTGRGEVRDGVLTLGVEAASPRLAISGSGWVALTSEAEADLTFSVTNTSLDPYILAFEPRLPLVTTAVASGTISVRGELRNFDRLRVDGVVEELDLNLFDYRVRNEGPIRVAVEQRVVRIERMQLTGEETQLDLTGTIDLATERIAMRATGDASLGILQGLFPDLRSSGNAELHADIGGSLGEPLFRGEAFIYDGRFRHFSLPHALESINGQILFEPGSISFERLNAALGGGAVRFGGRIGLDGYTPGELDVSAEGEQMQLRYPEGFRSVVDARLTLQGDFYDPLLTGTVTVRDAVWIEQFEATPGLFDFAGGDQGPEQPTSETTLPLRFDMRLVAPSSLRIEDNRARIVATADLTLRGTYDSPLLFGNMEIERGEVFFEGHQYRVTRGSIGFANPTKLEPFFDIEAETNVLVPGQIYRVVFRATGTTEQFIADFSSDPPLPQVDILSLLLGDVRDPQSGELRALRAPAVTEQQRIQSGAARLLTNPLSSGVGRVVEQSFGVDTFQITPSLGDPSAQQSAEFNPTARLLIGKRISDRAHLTLSRALTGAGRDLIVVLEYNQSDRHSWVLSQNEDRTYALDFRVRHAF